MDPYTNVRAHHSYTISEDHPPGCHLRTARILLLSGLSLTIYTLLVMTKDYYSTDFPRSGSYLRSRFARSLIQSLTFEVLCNMRIPATAVPCRRGSGGILIKVRSYVSDQQGRPPNGARWVTTRWTCAFNGCARRLWVCRAHSLH